jgi:hypothetical protein
LLVFVVWLVRHNTSGELVITSPVFPLLFVTVFGLLYMSHVMLGRYELFGPRYVIPVALKESMICGQCRITQIETESHLCSCGGTLEPLDHWRWTNGSR